MNENLTMDLWSTSAWVIKGTMERSHDLILTSLDTYTTMDLYS